MENNPTKIEDEITTKIEDEFYKKRVDYDYQEFARIHNNKIKRYHELKYGPWNKGLENDQTPINTLHYAPKYSDILRNRRARRRNK